MLTQPCVGLTVPFKSRKSEVLPAPLGPTKATASPALISKLIERKATCPLYDKATSFSLKLAAGDFIDYLIRPSSLAREARLSHSSFLAEMRPSFLSIASNIFGSVISIIIRCSFSINPLPNILSRLGWAVQL